MMTDTEIKTALRRMRSAKTRINKYQAEYDANKDMLKEHLKESGLTLLEMAGYKMRLETISTTTLDSKKLKAALPETWDLFSRTTTTEKFTVSGAV